MKVPKIYLGKRGYILRKDGLSDAKQKAIRKTFTVKPFVPRGIPQGPANEPFELFLENKSKFYLPKQKAREMFGEPEVNKLPPGQDRPDLQFVGSLRDYQVEIADRMMDACHERGGGICSIPGGRGKCMARGTPLLMADGTVKPIEEVHPGDLLMGDDSKPRTVQTTCRGRDIMYRIEMPAHQVSYVVNGAHILCLRRKNRERDVLEINVKDFIANEDKYQQYGGYSAPFIKFPIQREKLRLDSYIMGFWLGCGEMVRVNVDKKMELLRYYNAYDRHNIPYRYRCGSSTDRWRLLGGLVDGAGIYNIEKKRFELTLPLELRRDTLFVVRSLGYRATVYDNIIHIDGRYLHRIYTLIDNNKKCVTNEIEEDYRVSSISVTRLGEDDYFGFMLDGNGRYLLESFTVTHNTVIALNIATSLKKKTLVVVHQNFLADQWIRRIKGGMNPDTNKFEPGFIPDAKVGRIQAQIYDIDDKDIVIAMLQSISMKEYPLNTFDSFGLVIIDECHRIPCRGFSKALRKINAPYMIGLTATPKRTDGLFRIVHWYLGALEYIMKEDTKENKRKVEAHRYIYESDDTDYSKLAYNRIGGLDNVKMLSKLCEYKPRTAVICNKTYEIALAGRTILTLSERRGHLKEMEGNYRDRVLYELMPLVESEIWEAVLDAPLDDDAVKVYIRKKIESKKLDVVIEEYEADREDLANTIFTILADTIPLGQDLAHKLHRMLEEGDEITFDQVDLDVKYSQLSQELKEFQKIKTEVELVDYLKVLYESSFKREQDLTDKLKEIFHQLGSQGKIKKREYSVMMVKNRSQKAVDKVMLKLSRARQDQIKELESELTKIREELKPLRKVLSNSKRRYIGAVRDVMDILTPIVKIHVYRAILEKPRHPLSIRTGYYIGGMKDHERQRSENCEIILGTYQMASEGLDIPALNTLVMSTPKGHGTNVFKQATWRIMRKEHINFHPLIVDFCDLYGSYRDKAAGRLRYYKRLKYPITTTVLDYTGDVKETFAELPSKDGKRKRRVNSLVKEGRVPHSKNLLKGKNIFAKNNS